MVCAFNHNIVGQGRNSLSNFANQAFFANKIGRAHIHRDWRGGDLIERVKRSRDVIRIGPVFDKLLESVSISDLILVFRRLKGFWNIFGTLASCPVTQILRQFITDLTFVVCPI